MKRGFFVLVALAACVTLAACSSGESPEVKEYKENEAVAYYTNGDAFDDLLAMSKAEGDSDKATEAGMRIADRMGELTEVRPPESCTEAQTSLLNASVSVADAATCYLKCTELYEAAMVDLDADSLSEYKGLLEDAGKCQDEALKLVEQAKTELP